MEDGHAGIASYLHMHGDVAGEVSVNLGLLGGFHSGIDDKTVLLKPLLLIL